MATKLQIWNLALNHLGMQSLSSTTLDDPRVNALNAYYDFSVQECIREVDWTFAKSQSVLTELDIDILGWDFAYTYPASCAIIWNVYNDATYEDKESQEFEEIFISTLNCSAIVTDIEDAYADYEYQVTDESRFDPNFTEALSYKLAAKISHQLIGDPAIGLKMMEIYGALISEAKRINAYQKKKKVELTSGYVNAR